MASKALIGIGASIAVPLVLVAGIAIQATTSDSAAADPNTGAIGGGLRAGSVPPQYAPWIEKAAGACPGLPAPVLAAQLQQESGFSPVARSDVGAQGMAQFMPGTWKTWAVDADRDGVASPLDPPDAITAQGRLMCALLRKGQRSGYPGEPIELALAGYNAGWGAVERYGGVPPALFAEGETYNYVQRIMASAHRFTAEAGPAGAVALPAGFQFPAGTPARVRTAVGWAMQQRGGWYRWGGSCTDAHGSDPGKWCDCSSLMQQAYRAAGITISRTTFAQVNEGQSVRIDAPQPGDLVFTAGSDGTASRPGHVGMYIGQGLIVEAPRTGQRTRLIPYSSWRHSSSALTRIVAVRRVAQW